MYASDMRHPSPALEEKLLRLYALKSGGPVELSFRKPYLDLLRAFGDPHLKLPPVIHVAGTNGKGSIVAMLRSILEAQGCRVHAYTSPHLLAFNERIVLAGKAIADEAVAKGMKTLRMAALDKAMKQMTSLEEVMRVTFSQED